MYTVTVERPSGQDAHGNKLPPTTHTLDHCWDAPAGSTEENHEEATVEWDLDLQIPYDADLLEHDVVLLPGDTTRYQVHGRPARWRAPTGWKAGTMARLKGVG